MSAMMSVIDPQPYQVWSQRIKFLMGRPHLGTLSDGLGLMKREEPALSEGSPLSPSESLLINVNPCWLVSLAKSTVRLGSWILSCCCWFISSWWWFISISRSWSPVSKLWLLWAGSYKGNISNGHKWL